MVERRTRDRKASGSSPCRSSGRIFFSKVSFLCLERLSGYEQSLQHRVLRTFEGNRGHVGTTGRSVVTEDRREGFLGDRGNIRGFSPGVDVTGVQRPVEQSREDWGMCVCMCVYRQGSQDSA